MDARTQIAAVYGDMEKLTDAELAAELGLFEKRAKEWGLEMAPLTVGWYNQALEDKSYTLNFPPNTVALALISNPSFFTQRFMPYLQSDQSSAAKKDPFDDCMRQTVDTLVADVTKVAKSVKVIHDFEMDPETFRPDFLAQVAAHACGIARCYRQQDLDSEGLKSYQQLNGGKEAGDFFGHLAQDPRLSGDVLDIHGARADFCQWR